MSEHWKIPSQADMKRKTQNNGILWMKVFIQVNQLNTSLNMMKDLTQLMNKKIQKGIKQLENSMSILIMNMIIFSINIWITLEKKILKHWSKKCIDHNINNMVGNLKKLLKILYINKNLLMMQKLQMMNQLKKVNLI